MVWKRKLAAGDQDAVIDGRIEQDNAGEADAECARCRRKFCLCVCKQTGEQWH